MDVELLVVAIESPPPKRVLGDCSWVGFVVEG